MHQRTFSRAARSDNRDHLARRYLKVDVVQDFASASSVLAVREGYVLELDVSRKLSAVASAPGFSRTSSSMSMKRENLRRGARAPAGNCC